MLEVGVGACILCYGEAQAGIDELCICIICSLGIKIKNDHFTDQKHFPQKRKASASLPALRPSRPKYPCE